MCKTGKCKYERHNGICKFYNSTVFPKDAFCSKLNRDVENYHKNKDKKLYRLKLKIKNFLIVLIHELFGYCPRCEKYFSFPKAKIINVIGSKEKIGFIFCNNCKKMEAARAMKEDQFYN